MQKIKNPHDLYFRSSLSDLRIAKDFFQTHLPPSILEITDLNTLKLQNTTFIDKNLQETESDILYSARFKNGKLAYFYILVEHQRRKDKWMSFRVLRYMMEIMTYHLKQGGKTLPVVIPIVFYNGKKPYSHPIDLWSLFSEPDLAKEYLYKPFTLVDLTQIPDEELKQHPWVGIMELLQKHISSRHLIKVVKEMIIPLLQPLDASFRDYVMNSLRYLMEGQVEDSPRAVKIAIEALSIESGENHMTSWASQLRQEGKQEGKQEGRQEGREETQHLIAKNLLAHGMSVALVIQITGLSKEAVERLSLQAVDTD